MSGLLLRSHSDRYLRHKASPTTSRELNELADQIYKKTQIIPPYEPWVLGLLGGKKLYSDDTHKAPETARSIYTLIQASNRDKALDSKILNQVILKLSQAIQEEKKSRDRTTLQFYKDWKKRLEIHRANILEEEEEEEEEKKRTALKPARSLNPGRRRPSVRPPLIFSKPISPDYPDTIILLDLKLPPPNSKARSIAKKADTHLFYTCVIRERPKSVASPLIPQTPSKTSSLDLSDSTN